MRVARWGNSLAIRIPSAVVDALQLVEGDDIEVVVASETRLLYSVHRRPQNA